MKIKNQNLLIIGIRRNSLSRAMYFNIFMPFFIGRSTSASMMSIYCPSAFNASITCLADFTDVTVKHDKSIVIYLREYLTNCRSIKSYDSIHSMERKGEKTPQVKIMHNTTSSYFWPLILTDKIEPQIH